MCCSCCPRGSSGLLRTARCIRGSSGPVYLQSIQRRTVLEQGLQVHTRCQADTFRRMSERCCLGTILLRRAYMSSPPSRRASRRHMQFGWRIPQDSCAQVCRRHTAIARRWAGAYPPRTVALGMLPLNSLYLVCTRCTPSGLPQTDACRAGKTCTSRCPHLVQRCLENMALVQCCRSG